jgi:hypothetical protein
MVLEAREYLTCGAALQVRPLSTCQFVQKHALRSGKSRAVSDEEIVGLAAYRDSVGGVRPVQAVQVLFTHHLRPKPLE